MSKTKPKKDWSEPTTYIKRFGDAMELICGGHRPDDSVMLAWLEPGSESVALQMFAADHGPAWAQGIEIIDAAMLMANTPTEGVEHEMRIPLSVALNQEIIRLQSLLAEAKLDAQKGWERHAMANRMCLGYQNERAALIQEAESYPPAFRRAICCDGPDKPESLRRE
jgi:hypothetical protein